MEAVNVETDLIVDRKSFTKACEALMAGVSQLNGDDEAIRSAGDLYLRVLDALAALNDAARPSRLSSKEVA